MQPNDLNKKEESAFGEKESDWYESVKPEKSKPKDDNKANGRSIEDIGQEEKNKLGQGYTASSVSKKAKSKMNSALKKRLAFFGVSAIGLLGVLALNFFLSFSGGGIQNLDRLLDSYRMATINRQFANRVTHIALNDTLNTGNNRPSTARGSNSLFQKMSGWNSRKAMRAIGASNLEFNFERRAGRNVLVSVTDRLSNRTISRDNLGTGAFARQVTDLVDLSIREGEIGNRKFMRRNTVNLVRQNAGIRFYKFREFINRRGDNLTRNEARQILNQETLEDARRARRTVRSNLGVVNDAVDQQTSDVEEGRVRDPGIDQDRVRAATRISGFSDAAFIATMSCIAGDISGQTLEVIENRIYGPMRAYAEFKTKMNQRQIGDVTPEAIEVEADRWNDWHLSGAAQMALNRPHSEIDEEMMLSDEDFPFTIFGMQVSTVRRLALFVNFVSNPIEGTRTAFTDRFFPDNELDIDALPEALEDGELEEDTTAFSELPSGCDILLNPYSQGAIAGVEIVTTIVSFGGVRAALAGVTSSWRVAARIIAGNSAGWYVFNRVLPSYVDALAGFDGMALEGEGPDNANKIDLGLLLMKNSIGVKSGASTISPQLASQQQRESVARYMEVERSKGFVYGYFSPENPFSLTTNVAINLKNTFSSPAKPLNTIASLVSSPFSLISKVQASNGNYPPEEEFYGMHEYQFGWEDALIEGVDERFSHTENIIFVEENFDRLRDNYAECFNFTMVDLASRSSYPDKCSEVDAKRYGMYLLDCISIDQVINEGSDTDSFESTACNFIRE